MNEVLLGLLGAALGLTFFACGFWMGRRSIGVPKANEFTGAIQVQPTEEEKAQIEKERARLRSEQNAFHDLLGYNADVAYGVVSMSEGKE